MGNRLRRLGVYGANLPTKKSKTVQASDFLIGGIIGFFERRYLTTMLCNNPQEFEEKMGLHKVSTYYGSDCVKGFFDNIVGTDGKLYVKSYVGNTGGSIDAVVANKTLVDDGTDDTLKLESAYQTELDYSTSGNRTGYTITQGNRFSTKCKTAGTKDDTFVILDSIADVKVGDVMKFVATAGGGATVYKKITSIDESTGTVNFSGAFHGSANMDVDDEVTIPGFRLRIWRKSVEGVVSEVDEELGKVYCSMEDEVTDYYVENVFSSSKWVKATDLDSSSSIGQTLPANVTTVTYLESGANGTSPTLTTQWGDCLSAFDDNPIRFIGNCETTDEDVQKAIETYCQGRWDNPKVVYNIASNRTKAQLIEIGNKFQRSDDVLGVVTANWLKVADPFATSTLAPDREIPNVGHVMGTWVRSIGLLGVHYIPAVVGNPIFGITGIVGDTFLNDEDRTDIAEAGVNLIQYIKGTGYVIKNFFTPSTTTEFMFANGILMREYIKISVRDSLLDTENEPNSYERIKNSKMAVLNFFYRLWEVGSTGNVPSGETFGQSIDEEGNATNPADHFQVQADLVNNPQSTINAGERNLDSWFTYPTPAGSIKIGVGLMLR